MPIQTPTLPLPRIDPIAFWIFVFAAIILAGIVLGLAARTALLRDACPSVPDFRMRPYSLAKSQLEMVGRQVVWFSQRQLLDNRAQLSA